MSRNILIGIVVVIILVAGGWWYLNQSSVPSTSDTAQFPTTQNTDTETPVATNPTSAQQVPKTTTQTNQTPPANVSQFTKTQVLNGYDQCGNQFSGGEITVALDAPCAGYVTLFADNMMFADLDRDGVLEAVVPARVALGSSGGALYVFKNQSGTARGAAVAGIGKENIE